MSTFCVRDPVQLNLLYEQAKEAILEGTHPVRLEDAIQFAALQVQIQFGDHKEDKHKVGMLAEWVTFDLFSKSTFPLHLVKSTLSWLKRPI